MNFKNWSTAFFSSIQRMTSIMIALMAFSLFLFIGANNSSFVFDEAYSMAMIQHSFSDIWNITATDVHPPLYYFMLKSFTLLFGDSLATLRVFSALGILGIFLLGMIPIRLYFGTNVSLVFVIIVSLLPVTQYLSDEIRMYSWAMFFTLANALAAYKVFKKSSILNNCVLFLSAFCAAYTHYYSLMGSITIFGLLLVFLILEKKNLTYTIVAFILFMVGYSFWIPELFNQIAAVKHNYWITSLTLKDLLLFSYYLFSPKEPTHPYLIFTLPVMAVALSFMLILIASIAGITIKKYKNLNRSRMITALVFIGTFFIPVISAIIISYIIKPIIIPRYMTCLLGCLVLGISILLVELYESEGKMVRRLILTSIFMLSILSVTRFFSEKEYTDKSNRDFYRIQKYFEKKNTEKAAFISTFSACGWLGMLSLMYPSDENLYFVYSERETFVNYKPFKLIEVNKLPTDFDFHYTQAFDSNPIQTRANNHFMNGIKANYCIEDSMVQMIHLERNEGREIFLMKTIHRERENQQNTD